MVCASQISSIVRNAFNFSVEKFPLQGPENMRTPWYGLFRDDNGEPVGSGSVSDGYEPHTVDDVIATVEAAAVVFDGEVDIRCHWRNGHHITVIPTKARRLEIYNNVDYVVPRLIINAGYNKSPFSVSLGVYRDMCRNLARLHGIAHTATTIRHTTGLRSRMDSMIESFAILAASWGTVAERIQRMESNKVSMRDFLNAIYPEPAADAPSRSVTIHRDRTEAIITRLLRERAVAGRPTWDTVSSMVTGWEAFNAVQGYIQHDSRRRGSDLLDPFDRMLIALDSPEVEHAERLALAS